MTIATRRTALVALASAAAAAPLLLQTRFALAQDAAGDYRTQTLEAGTLALQTSQIAVEKGTHELVTQFAELEVAEQTTMAEILTAAGATAPALPENRAAMVAELEGMEAGPQFDMAYIDGQIQGHEELLAIQQTLSGMDELSVEVVTAKLAEQAITSHLAMLNHIRTQLGAA